MSSYAICPTCAQLFSNKILPYQRDIVKLCEKYNIDHELMSRGDQNNEKFNKEKQEIINKYTDPERYCCRGRLPNITDIVRIVN